MALQPQLEIGATEDPLELAADRTAQRVTCVAAAGRAISSSPLAVQRSPDCKINETILAYEGKPGQDRCITENDPEFRENYIDNNIVLATGLAVPDTTWENIDHDRIPMMKLTYKDGRTLIFEVKDIPLVSASGRVHPTQKTTGSFRPVARYEKRSDGFIYPIRSAYRADYVSYSDANNIMSLRAGLHEDIEELKQLFTLIETGATFGGFIAALGGIAALASHPGGLFEPIPKKKSQAPTVEEPATTPKKGRVPAQEEQHTTQKPTTEPVAVKGAKHLAEVSAEGGHTVRVSKGGLVEFCSEPCANISLVFRETLEQNRDLAKEFADIQTRARQAEKMIESGDTKLAAKGEAQAKQAASDAVRLQSKLAKTGITRGGTRFRPEPDLLGSGRHGLGWKDSDAVARAKNTGNPQGRFGGVEDIQFAAEQAARLGPGGQTTAPHVPLPAGTRSVVFLSNGTQRPATHVYVKVRSDGSFHAYPL